MSKRASYRVGVEWIGYNDEPGSNDVEEISEFISTLLLADLFGKNPRNVAEDIVRWRQNNYRAVGWPDKKGPR
jgi:hypothetical protein